MPQRNLLCLLEGLITSIKLVGHEGPGSSAHTDFRLGGIRSWLLSAMPPKGDYLWPLGTLGYQQDHKNLVRWLCMAVLPWKCYNYNVWANKYLHQLWEGQVAASLMLRNKGLNFLFRRDFRLIAHCSCLRALSLCSSYSHFPECTHSVNNDLHFLFWLPSEQQRQISLLKSGGTQLLIVC